MSVFSQALGWLALAAVTAGLVSVVWVAFAYDLRTYHAIRGIKRACLAAGQDWKFYTRFRTIWRFMFQPDSIALPSDPPEVAAAKAVLIQNRHAMPRALLRMALSLLGGFALAMLCLILRARLPGV